MAGGVRLTPSDAMYTAGPSMMVPYVAALEVELEAPVTVPEMRSAIGAALGAEPRMRSRPVGGRWEECYDAADVSILHVAGDEVSRDSPGGEEAMADAWDGVRSALADTCFETGIEAPVRVALYGRRALFAWSHASSDAPGAIGFVSTVTRALRGEALGNATPGLASWVERKVVTTSLGPGVLRSYVERNARRGPDRPMAVPWPISGPLGPVCQSAFRTLTGGEANRLAQEAKAAGGTFTGALCSALAGVCRERSDPGDAVVVYVPTNLRPRGVSRWRPVGNWIGSVELRLDGPTAPPELSRRLGAALATEAYTPVLTALARRMAPARVFDRLERRRAPDFGVPTRTVCCNNLGRVEEEMLPGVTRAFYHAPTDVNYPALGVITVGGNTTFTVRMRRHQGGESAANDLLEQALSRL